MIAVVFLIAAAAPGADTLDVRRVHSKLGQCVVERRPAAAAEYVLDLETDKADERKLHRQLPLVACLEKLVSATGGQLTLPADTLRYALADSLVRNERANSPISDFSKVPPLERATWHEEYFRPKPGTKVSARELDALAKNRTSSVEAFYLAAFGECAVRANPRAAHALLMTEPGSIQETARFAELRTSFSSCLKAGETLASTKLVLRGAIAMNYYRLAHAPRGTPAPKGTAQ